MTVNRRECLQMLVLSCMSLTPLVCPAQVHDDLWAATEPAAMPALDWGDVSAVLTSWRLSAWSHVATGHHSDLSAMLRDCCDASTHQLRSPHQAAVIVVLRGSCRRLHFEQCRAVSRAFCNAVGTCDLLFAAAPDPALVDALRLTVVVNTRA